MPVVGSGHGSLRLDCSLALYMAHCSTQSSSLLQHRVAQAVAESVWVRRAQFVPQMVNSLTKLGMAQGGSNLENRSLAIDLCGVMVLWEERRIKELQAGPGQVLSHPLQQVLHVPAGLHVSVEPALTMHGNQHLF